ncbi:MAG: sigma-70 family RNA polymerase sigma factor [Gemmatimonadaceae bacterium]|nr:sigma-70 family RNA polymerase sigma factor [Gemmatimonadaceae bacterium]
MTDVDRLFRTYNAQLVRYLTRRLGDSDLAEEVAQETFVRAMRQDAITNERAWLFAVATNLLRDAARRQERERKHLTLLAAESRDSSEDADVEAELSVERLRQSAAARRALGALGDRDRSALLMKEEGLSYPEIAEALDLSPGSVGTTLARARRRLVEAYEELEGKGERNDAAS